MYIVGDGVGWGYLNLLELMNKKFVNDLFVLLGWMYRIGDLVCLLLDGNIEFIECVDY